MSDVPPPSNSPANGPSGGQSPPPHIVIQQQQTALGRYGKLLLALLIIAGISIFGLVSRYQSYFSPPGGPQERFHSLSQEATEKIAIVDISGTIMEGDGFVKQQLDRIRDDKQVVALVLRIDSPGGTVTGSDYLYHHIRQLAEERRLPVVVSMGSMCASGGYYIAMAVGDQEEAIFAEPTTWTGSIGVVIPHYDISGMLANANIKDDSVVSHKYKLMGSPTRQLTEEEEAEERKLLQELVNRSFARFKSIVQSGRPHLKQNAEDFETVTTGQIFTAEQAVDLGLVDKIGFVEEAIDRAAALAGKDTDNLRCIKYEKPTTPIDALLNVQARGSGLLGSDLQSLLDLATPRAYFLYTSLPAILENSRP